MHRISNPGLGYEHVLEAISELRGQMYERDKRDERNERKLDELTGINRALVGQVARMSSRIQALTLGEANGNELTGLVVLHVEDTELLRRAMDRRLESAGAIVLSAGGIREALSLIPAESTVDVALVDERLPDGNGTSLCKELKLIRPGIRTVVTSGYPVTRGESVDAVLDKSDATFDTIRRALLGLPSMHA